MTLDHPIRRSLWIAAVYLLLTVAMKELGRRNVVSAEAVERLMGMLMGALVFSSMRTRHPRSWCRWRASVAIRHASRPFAGSAPGRWCWAAWATCWRRRWRPPRSRTCWLSACWHRPPSWSASLWRAARGSCVAPSEVDLSGRAAVAADYRGGVGAVRHPPYRFPDRDPRGIRA